jgi:hypothetical protein
MASSPSKVLDGVIYAILGEMHQCFLSCNSLDRGPPWLVVLKNCYNSSIYWLSQREGVEEEASF